MFIYTRDSTQTEAIANSSIEKDLEQNDRNEAFQMTRSDTIMMVLTKI